MALLIPVAEFINPADCKSICTTSLPATLPLLGWNELTKYPNKDCYEAMMSCNRTSFVPEVDGPRDAEGRILCGQLPLQIFSTTNPYGAGRGWLSVVSLTAIVTVRFNARHK